MEIIIKYILKSIWEKKLRTFIIIFSITVSTSMFFASITISNTLVKMQMEQWRNAYGYSDIIITSDKTSSTQYFQTGEALKYEKNMEYIVGSISGYALYNSDKKEKVGISLSGFDLDELQKLTPLHFTRELPVGDFNGSKIIISTGTSEKYSINVSDIMILNINGTKHKYTVYGIVNQTGPFANEGQIRNAIVPKEHLCSLYNARGKVDTIYIKLLNPLATPMIKYKLSLEYRRYSVKEPFNEKEIKRQSDSIATPILIVTVLLSFMTVYIIYSTFKIIVIDRLPIIGTFRSIGARKATTDSILLSESICYGLIGGALGCISGIVLLRVMSYLLLPREYGNGVGIQFNPTALLYTFVMANVLCLLSSILPIRKVSSISIKDIILNISQKQDTGRRRGLLPGLGLLAAALIIPCFVPDSVVLYINIVCILLSFLSVILLVPYITKISSGILMKIYPFIFGNEGILALKNIRDNRNLINNISLLVIGISFFFIIITANYGEINQVTSYFDRNSYDIIMNLNDANKSVLNKISSIEGIKDVFGNLSQYGTNIVGRDSNIWLVQGVDTAKLLDYYNIDMTGDKKSIVKELDTDRNILLTNSLRFNLDVKNGDILTLRFYLDNGSYSQRNYKIIGFFEDIIQGGGSYALISQRNFRQDIGLKKYDPIYIKSSGDVNDAFNVLNNIFARKKPVITTLSEKKSELMDNFKQVFTILKAFSIISLLVGILGILNNLIISFIQRKRSLAMFRSVGMSRSKITKMLLVESLTGGIIGGVLGIAIGTLNLSLLITRIMDLLNIFSRIYYSWPVIVGCATSGAVISLLTSVALAISIARLNIIEAIKYE